MAELGDDPEVPALAGPGPRAAARVVADRAGRVDAGSGSSPTVGTVGGSAQAQARAQCRDE